MDIKPNDLYLNRETGGLYRVQSVSYRPTMTLVSVDDPTTCIGGSFGCLNLQPFVRVGRAERTEGNTEFRWLPATEDQTDDADSL